MRRAGDSETEHAPRDAEQPTLDHELSHDVAIRGAERAPDRKLARAAGRAEEQQVADVDARDEEQEQPNRGERGQREWAGHRRPPRA